MTEPTVATTSRGAIRGVQEGVVLSFLGIRYALSPVGNLRWQPPLPAQPWQGVVLANGYPPLAPQVLAESQRARPGFTMDEDCLALNVWTPAVGDARHPVLVFVHGGGMMAGHGAARTTNGSALAARGAVVVTLNYRLGALGNLFAPDKLGPGSANLVLQDIAAAFAWVRQEIAAFGGDPANVTAIGQSSGGVAVSCLMASAIGQGAFDRAILQSGGLERVHSAEQGREIAERLFGAMELSSGEDPRALSVERLLAAQAKLMAGTRLIPPRGEFHPTIDGSILSLPPVAAAKAGMTAPIPLLVGTVADEWGYFDASLPEESFSKAMLDERVRLLRGADCDPAAVLGIYRRGLAHRGEEASNRKIASTLVSDFHFRAPTDQFARAHAAQGHPTYHYELTGPTGPGGAAPVHGACLPLLFGSHRGDAASNAVSRRMQDAWLAFARSGNPSTAERGEWPRYHAQQRTVVLLDGEDSARSERDRRREEIALWD